MQGAGLQVLIHAALKVPGQNHKEEDFLESTAAI